MKKVTESLRELVVTYFYDRDFDYYRDYGGRDSAEKIADLLSGGCKGYKEMSDEELLDQLIQTQSDLADRCLIEPSEEYKHVCELIFTFKLEMGL